MRVAIIGANGFLGSWIARVISDKHQVMALVRHGSPIWRLSGIKRISTTYFSEPELPFILRNNLIEVLIFSDWWGVSNFERNDIRQFENVKRFEKRLSWIQEFSTVIGVGSQAEIGPMNRAIYEEDFDGPTTQYGIAKVQTRLSLQQSLPSTTRFVWARIFSTYGPLDTDNWLIPHIVKNLMQGQHMPLTKGEQIWSYLHSYDLGQAFDAIISHHRIAGIVNVGNPKTVKIYEVAELIADLLERRDLLSFGKIPYRSDQVMTLIPVTKKLSSVNWTPKIELEDGLKHLIQWMQGEVKLKVQTTDRDYLEWNLPKYQNRN